MGARGRCRSCESSKQQREHQSVPASAAGVHLVVEKNHVVRAETSTSGQMKSGYCASPRLSSNYQNLRKQAGLNSVLCRLKNDTGIQR